ncbi:YndJ family protein [Paenactinomyces guangxiensis]|uniref:YndJ family protein n=1 Tax=Paenactinomyces guangxiensis TaxID=1490290 RepID=A0A7W1WMS0_9BACL|nr:YndJ family protein [Paenactinomyces guangxiensis]MBA4492705.1 YndJ family protein [Paenactinomyces guangxiensis]MBH8590447.1 YndJ family protein [Paenactinomyces guangxiensis]
MKKVFYMYSIFGTVAWIVLAMTAQMFIVDLFLYISILVLIPMGLQITNQTGKWTRLLVIIYPIAAVSSVLSHWYPIFSWAWWVFTILLAFFGIAHFIKQGGMYIEENMINFAWMYTAIGGTWLVAHAYNYALMGFDSMIVVLTANHFHYASLFPLLFHGLLGRELKSQGKVLSAPYKAAGIIMLVIPLFIAIGITYARWMEIAGALLFACSLIAYAVLTWKSTISGQRLIAKILLNISSVSVTVTILLSVIYAFGRWQGMTTISIPTMIMIHGAVNVFGFSVPGMIGYLMLTNKQHVPVSSIPFSKIKGTFPVGRHFFHKQGAIDEGAASLPAGMVDSMDLFTSASFHPNAIHPLIRSFYENTMMFELDVVPRWHPLFYPVAKRYKKLSQRMEQMNFPVSSNDRKVEVESAIFPLKDETDGRTNVRAWIRSEQATKKAFYVAAYSTHTNNETGERYYNIFFPLPFGGMTSVLRITHFQEQGVHLTSLSHTKHVTEQQGVYGSIGSYHIRLPINETIDVWVEDHVIKACHHSWLFGFRCLTLNYEIRKLKD